MTTVFFSVKDPWLVNGLYDTFAGSSSSKCLDVLISGIREPHDKFLLEKICEGLRVGGPQRQIGLDVLGCVVRKQKTWLHRITQVWRPLTEFYIACTYFIFWLKNHIWDVRSRTPRHLYLGLKQWRAFFEGEVSKTKTSHCVIFHIQSYRGTMNPSLLKKQTW